jgi:hypothetical protein
VHRQHPALIPGHVGSQHIDSHIASPPRHGEEEEERPHVVLVAGEEGGETSDQGEGGETFVANVFHEIQMAPEEGRQIELPEELN